MLADTANAGVPAHGTTLPFHRAMLLGVANALEFYDFLIFSFFAAQIERAFFPPSLSAHGLLLSLATFGLGFITRPLGAILIGTYADHAGRRPAMLLSLTLMGFATLGCALTPSFAHIGLAAPTALLLFRLVQGFALGGEVGVSTAYLFEVAPPRRCGLYVSIQPSTQGLALVLGSVVIIVLSLALPRISLESWGWRIAFLLGAAVVPVGLYLRRKLPETLHMGKPLAAPANYFTEPAARPRLPLQLIGLGLLTMGAMSVATYVLGYMNTYAQDSLGLGPTAAFVAVVVNGVCFLVAAPGGGALSDRFGSIAVMRYALMLLLMLVVPSYVVLNRFHNVVMLCMVTAIMSIVAQTASVAILVTVTERLPRVVRAATLGTVYATAIAVFGGSAQFVIQWLVDVTRSTLAPAGYLCLALVVGGVAMVILKPESSPMMKAKP